MPTSSQAQAIGAATESEAANSVTFSELVDELLHWSKEAHDDFFAIEGSQQQDLTISILDRLDRRNAKQASETRVERWLSDVYDDSELGVLAQEALREMPKHMTVSVINGQVVWRPRAPESVWTSSSVRRFMES